MTLAEMAERQQLSTARKASRTYEELDATILKAEERLAAQEAAKRMTGDQKTRLREFNRLFVPFTASTVGWILRHYHISSGVNWSGSAKGDMADDWARSRYGMTGDVDTLRHAIKTFMENHLR